MHQSKKKKILLTVGVLLLIGSLLSAGTLATFTAQTTNPGNVLGNGTMTMTNVAGSVVSGSDCSTSTSNGTCATLFSAGTTGFVPGGADSTNTVTITYTGTITTATFGLHVANYASEAVSSPASCTAADPASKINLQIVQGSGPGTIIYPIIGSGYGTLANFATTYTGTGALLHLDGGTDGSGATDVWANGDNSLFTINVNLDASADNTYQGCLSEADFVWYAAQ